LVWSFVALIAVAISGTADEGPSENPSSGAVQSFLSAHWVDVRTPANVDPTVVEALRARFGDDKRLAGPGEPFDATDVLHGRPRRRFVLAGRAEKLWFVAYERGGIAHYMILTVFDSSRRPPVLRLVALGSAGSHNDAAGWQVTSDQLKEALQDGSLSDPERSYY
jgi:hypothetical protein